MTECRDCGTEIKHVGDGVWIDNTKGDCCWETDECHRPRHEPGGLLDEIRQAERVLEREIDAT